MVTPQKTLDRLDGIEADALALRAERDRLARRAPEVSLWEATTVGLRLRGPVSGEYAGSVEWVVGDTGTATIELPAEHPLATWCARWFDRDKEVVVLRVDHNGARWCGTMSRVVTTQGDDGDRSTRVEFMHDYEQFKHLPVYPNPVLPSGLQVPKVYQMIGKAASIMAITLQLNLLRHHTLLNFNLPDDVLDPSSWMSQWNWRDWPMLVHPINYVDDKTPIRYIGARMEMFHDVIAPICEDVQIHVDVTRWFPGDPDPWPGARLTRPGQMIVRFVDKSGWFEGTSTFGSVGGGLVRTVLELADGAVEEARRVVDERPNAPEYEVSRWLGVAPMQPYVTYLTKGETNMVNSVEEVYTPPTVGTVTVGGQSMPGVNETISAAVKVVFNLFGSFIPGGAGFGSIVDGAIQPIYENTVLAFQTVDLILRTRRLGWGHYMEDTDVGSVEAYTIGALMRLRALRRASEGTEGFTVDVGDGLPYTIGGTGRGHWHIADRIGLQSLHDDDRIVAMTCQKLVLDWSADQPHAYTATIGQWPRRDPVLWAIGRIGDLAQDIQKQGLM